MLCCEMFSKILQTNIIYMYIYIYICIYTYIIYIYMCVVCEHANV